VGDGLLSDSVGGDQMATLIQQGRGTDLRQLVGFSRVVTSAARVACSGGAIWRGAALSRDFASNRQRDVVARDLVLNVCVTSIHGGLQDDNA
jgi:hypothetical protein